MTMSGKEEFLFNLID